MTTVRVVDRVPYEADVSPAQVLAYVRRVLPAWTQEPWLNGKYIDYEGPNGESITIPLHEKASDYGRMVTDVCDNLAGLGIVAQPSQALRAMQAEVVP